jgi:hypothetical protein
MHPHQQRESLDVEKGYKLFLAALACLAMGSVEAWGQCETWTRSTIRNCDGIDYELWNQNNRGTVNMQITGGNSKPNGGTFSATWSGTENILFRAGKKWGFNTTTTARDVGTISLDFAATWTSNDNVKMLGIYGWAYYPEGSQPTKTESGQNTSFSNQIEYYIIQDRGGFNPGASGVNAKKYGEATIDGIAYDFWVADRINQPMLTGRGNFKQYFSVPQNTSDHRQSGVVTISKHFEEWDKAGMKMMDCPLYEVAMKVESYTGSPNGGGSASVTKNLLTLGKPTALSRDAHQAAMLVTNPVAFVQGRTLNVLPVDGAPLRIRVRDVNGKNRFDFTTLSNSGAATFSLDHVPAGRYVLDVSGGSAKQVTPIVLW